jgi:hypothetical protein
MFAENIHDFSNILFFKVQQIVIIYRVLRIKVFPVSGKNDLKGELLIRRMDPLLYFHSKQIFHNISTIKISKYILSGKLGRTLTVVLKNKTHTIRNVPHK